MSNAKGTAQIVRWLLRILVILDADLSEPALEGLESTIADACQKRELLAQGECVCSDLCDDCYCR